MYGRSHTAQGRTTPVCQNVYLPLHAGTALLWLVLCQTCTLASSGQNIHIQNPGNSDISDFSDIFSDNSNTSDISGNIGSAGIIGKSEMPEVSVNRKYRNYRKIGIAGII